MFKLFLLYPILTKFNFTKSLSLTAISSLLPFAYYEGLVNALSDSQLQYANGQQYAKDLMDKLVKIYQFSGSIIKLHSKRKLFALFLDDDIDLIEYFTKFELINEL